MKRRILNEGSYNVDGMDVLFSKNDGSELQIFSSTSYPLKNAWTPIGVVVIPAGHNRYGNNKCGIIALTCVKSDGGGQVPSTGSDTDSYTLTWGSKTDTSLTNYNGLTESTSGEGYVSYQANQSSTGITTKGLWYPYTSSTKVNIAVYTGGCLSAYNGDSNSNVLNSTSYPAAYACKHYSTLGTNVGDWHLPTAGELGYIPSVKYEINKTITALNNLYGNIGTLIGTGSTYWTSSENNANRAWYVYMADGGVGIYYGSQKAQANNVRPFYCF